MDLYTKYSYVTQTDYESIAGPDWPSFSVFQTHNDVPDFVYNEIRDMLKPPARFEHPSFCVLPFYGIEYPSNTPCCFLPQNTNRIQIQQEMLAGRRPDACNTCWRLEDAGITSDRMLKNEAANLYHTNIETLFDQCVNQQSEIAYYKIDTSNTCNSTCITCNSSFSSSWAKLEKANDINPAPSWSIKPHTVDQQINYQTAKTVGFRGGEPLMSKTNFYVLEQLIKHNNTDCFVSFTTNGSVKLSSRQREILSQFKNLNFCFSIDGVGPVFDYLRYPLKFDTLVQNIQACRDIGIKPSVSYTVSNMNVLYHSQTVNWFNQNELKFIVNLVKYPKHFRPGALPKKVKQHIIQQNQIDLSFLLQDHLLNDDQDFEQFKAEITKQDAWKNIQLKHYLPELANLIDL